MATFTDEQRALFQEANLVNVATLGKDGTPRTVAIWVDIEGDEVLLNGANSRGWLQNLRRDPHVALAIFDLKNTYRQVDVIGEAVSISEEGAEQHIDKLAHKYMGTDYPNHLADDPRVLVRVKVNKISGNMAR